MPYQLVLEFSLFFLPDLLLRVLRAAIGKWNEQGFRRLFQHLRLQIPVRNKFVCKLEK